MSQFDDETAVRALPEGRYEGMVAESWSIGDNPNGGYLLSIALRAIAGAGAHPDPISITTHFLRPGTPGGRADVEVDLVRRGRTISTCRATLAQEGKQRIEVLAAMGDLADESAGPALTIPPADIPPPDECPPRSGDEQGVSLPILDRLDTRIHPAQAVAGRAGVAEVSGWIRFADGRPTDSAALPLFADAFPPSLFSLLGDVGWVPTVELTVHVRRRPAPGWIMGRFTTADLGSGRMLEDGCLWDETGALVAQSRQLALLLS